MGGRSGHRIFLDAANVLTSLFPCLLVMLPVSPRAVLCVCVVQVWEHLEDADDRDAAKTVAMNEEWSKTSVGKFGFFIILA